MELKFKWDCGDGHFDHIAHMTLELDVWAESGFFTVNRLLSVECDRLETRCRLRRDPSKEKPVLWTDDDTANKWYRDRFIEHYNADKLNLQDEVQDQACEAWAAERNKAQ